MRKTGLLVMALVLALGTLGVGYAAWTDTITIDGTVNTGDVDVTVEKYSGTYVWKTNSTPFIDVDSGWMADIGSPPTGAVDAFPNWVSGDPMGTAGVDPVGCATAVSKGDDEITVDFVNMFPCVDFTADFLLHYAGSIPVKVSMSNIAVTGITGATATIKYYESDVDGTQGTEITVPVGMQLHYCDYILVVITIHLDQATGEMNGTGSVSGTITVKQWNE